MANSILNMLGNMGNMANMGNNNPMGMIMQAIASGKTPQQFIQELTGMSGNLQEIAQKICKEKGLDYDQQLNNVKNMINNNK